MSKFDETLNQFLRKKKIKIKNLSENLFLNNILDSFGVIELVSLIERKHKIKIKANDLNTKNFSNFRNIKKLLKKYERS